MNNDPTPEQIQDMRDSDDALKVPPRERKRRRRTLRKYEACEQDSHGTWHSLDKEV